MKNFLIISIIILITFTFTGSKLYISDKSKTQLKEKIDIQSRQKELDKFYSEKKLGSFVESGKTYFRLFAPSAEKVSLVLFYKVDDANGKEYEMTRDENAVWEVSLDGKLYGKFYGFNVKHKDKEPVLCLDPYAKAVASYNTYFTPRKSIIVKEDNYDWQDDTWVQRDWRDIVVYEMHIRDMTEHPSSGAKLRGTYQGLVEKGKTGGIDYLKNLGVNTIELLPAQDFANIEIPFKDSLRGKFNTWNPYERNHWGYMTAAFFAPEEYYTENVRNIEFNKWSGADAKAVTDFKDMVKAFHKEDIAVIMDVVYNHLSEYEFGNLKEIDREYYFRLNPDGSYCAVSGCGNDLRTEAPMLRRLIVESVLYWMKEYHVDGFRFDLGKLLDWQTIETIIYEAKKINPDVVFVCEPWGGGYDPQGFSLRGWGAWNDQIRNGIKGENPIKGHGWIFGTWYGNNSPQRIKSYVNGTLTKDSLGLFQKPDHSVNYLESHDGYTFGDFIRIGLGDVKPDQVITDVDENAKLTPTQLKVNKLGALFLFTSRGMTMIHSGQEYARSKVLPLTNQNDPHRGMIDHNTYDKDNEVNYINYNHAKLNQDLFDYYKGLIELRKTYKSFRRAEYDDVKFISVKDNEFALGYEVTYEDEHFVVLFNAHPIKEVVCDLPKGKWEVLADKDKAGTKVLNEVKGMITIPTSSGLVLKKK
ncbi:MAG: alpha-amylase family glycosyl hydrolase [Ignavibacterium sp.]|jgi:pullulanase/glycogen debranching enzyme|nr:alpha-amylase family glycosyl hydrolase [Ignavibacterium sp.]